MTCLATTRSARSLNLLVVAFLLVLHVVLHPDHAHSQQASPGCTPLSDLTSAPPTISAPDTRRSNATLHPSGSWDAHDGSADSGYIVNTAATSALSVDLHNIVWAEDGAAELAKTEADAMKTYGLLTICVPLSGHVASPRGGHDWSVTSIGHLKYAVLGMKMESTSVGITLTADIPGRSGPAKLELDINPDAGTSGWDFSIGASSKEVTGGSESEKQANAEASAGNAVRSETSADVSLKYTSTYSTGTTIAKTARLSLNGQFMLRSQCHGSLVHATPALGGSVAISVEALDHIGPTPVRWVEATANGLLSCIIQPENTFYCGIGAPPNSPAPPTPAAGTPGPAGTPVPNSGGGEPSTPPAGPPGAGPRSPYFIPPGLFETDGDLPPLVVPGRPMTYHAGPSIVNAEFLVRSTESWAPAGPLHVSVRPGDPLTLLGSADFYLVSGSVPPAGSHLSFSSLNELMLPAGVWRGVIPASINGAGFAHVRASFESSFPDGNTAYNSIELASAVAAPEQWGFGITTNGSVDLRRILLVNGMGSYWIPLSALDPSLTVGDLAVTVVNLSAGVALTSAPVITMDGGLSAHPERGTLGNALGIRIGLSGTGQFELVITDTRTATEACTIPISML